MGVGPEPVGGMNTGCSIMGVGPEPVGGMNTGCWTKTG
jgi:hypothetical protein